MLDLAAIQARCEQATKGEWVWDGEAIVRRELSPTKRRPERVLSYPIVSAILEGDGFQEGASIFAGDADIAFLCHARSDVPALVAEVHRLRELVEAAYNEGVEQGHSFPWDESNAKRLLDGGTE